MLDDERVVELIYMILGSTILGLFGFVWRVSHRVSDLRNRIDALQTMHRRDIDEVQKDIDSICSNVDRQREWSTNRMMSIVRDSKS